MEGFGLSEKQSQAILDMRLQRLTGLETDKIISEYKDIIQHISELKGILESKSKRMEIIKEELLEVKENMAKKEEQK
jgi:DNA gyrase subunit A